MASTPLNTRDRLLEEFAKAKTIHGPTTMFNDSFTIEFLEPPSELHATVLMRATYLSTSPLTSLGPSHPQCPPLHLHFSQSESFLVASGSIGTTSTYAAKKEIWTSDSLTEPHCFEPWVPHTFWPGGDTEVDSVVYVWAHPKTGRDEMDWLFFLNLLGLVSDVTEKKVKMDVVQIMVLQHASATALVWFPGASFLGPLRWWIPYQMQTFFAFIGRLMGYRALIEKYTPKEEWEKYLHEKRA